jgi:hypothetical protein
MKKRLAEDLKEDKWLSKLVEQTLLPVRWESASPFLVTISTTARMALPTVHLPNQDPYSHQWRNIVDGIGIKENITMFKTRT